MKRLLSVYLLLIGLTMVISCEKDQVIKSSDNTAVSTGVNKQQSIVGYKTYIIKKGAHYSSPNPYKLISKSQLIFNTIFDSSCIYTTIDPVNQLDINKLYGFSDCNSQHLVNSARIGWYWNEGALHISAFVHNDGNMIYQDIVTAPIGSVINCRITCLASVYQFEVNGVVVELPRHCSGKYTRYKLNPYFGGDEVAPHAIKILIADL